MADDKVDVIVVGAGVAGSALALELARAGLEVALIERGPFPGSKNVSGGVLYGHALGELIPNFWEQAPVERHITNQVVTFMTADAHVNLDFKTRAFDAAPFNGFSVLRSKFDRWLAGQAEEAGAMLVAGIKVDEVLRKDGRVVGIRAGEDEMFADVVVAADGANSFLAQQAGLRGSVSPGQAGVGVKEVVGLPRAVIEERFHLINNEGSAYNIVGHATQGVAGGGFLYTNQESLSIGLVMRVDALVAAKLKASEVFEDFLAHPMIAPLIAGGELLEYGAHLVPEGGLKSMPEMVSGGMLVIGDAAGLGVNNGFVIRGMDLAIGSAHCAAQAILAAKKAGDYSATGLSSYKSLLDSSFVMADMRTYAGAVGFLENERMYHQYPDLLTDLFTRIYAQESLPKRRVSGYLGESLRESQVGLVNLLVDALKGARAL